MCAEGVEYWKPNIWTLDHIELIDSFKIITVYHAYLYKVSNLTIQAEWYDLKVEEACEMTYSIVNPILC